MCDIDRFFSGPLGIASSCLTEDFDVIKKLVSPLLDTQYSDVLGWLTLKTMSSGSREHYSRIVNLDPLLNKPRLPNTIICRGQHTSLGLDKAAEITKNLRKWFKYKKCDVSIKISLEAKVLPTAHINQLEKLNELGAEFDGVELALKYPYKLIQKKYEGDDPLDLNVIRNTTIEQYGTALFILGCIRIGLERIGKKNLPIFLKLSMDNLEPELMAVLLLEPGHDRFKSLMNSILKEHDKMRDRAKDGPVVPTINDLKKAILRKTDCVVLYDSEKMPFFLPDMKDPRQTIIPKSEGGYHPKGGALTGKALAKDSMKSVYSVYRHLRECGVSPEDRIIASGGCDSGESLATRLVLGASGVEVCTSLIAEGAFGLERIAREYSETCVRWNMNFREIQGIAHKCLVKRELSREGKFDDRVEKCSCEKCTSICWRTSEYAKDKDDWPPEGCVMCGSCVTLCQTGRLSWV